MDFTSAWREMEQVHISNPSHGEPLNPVELGYVQRSSAETQADFWNVVLAEHPTLSPAACGHRVGVGDKKQAGFLPLVWLAA